MSKKVYLLWFGQTVSWTGSSMSFFAIGVWIYETTGKASALSTILFIVAIVGVVTGPFGGVLADRFPRKTNNSLGTLSERSKNRTFRRDDQND